MSFQARGSRLSVVSVVCEKGIIRAIAHYTEPHTMIDELVKAVGKLNLDEVEWTGGTYHPEAVGVREGTGHPLAQPEATHQRERRATALATIRMVVGTPTLGGPCVSNASPSISST